MRVVRQTEGGEKGKEKQINKWPMIYPDKNAAYVGMRVCNSFLSCHPPNPSRSRIIFSFGVRVTKAMQTAQQKHWGRAREERERERKRKGRG